MEAWLLKKLIRMNKTKNLFSIVAAACILLAACSAQNKSQSTIATSTNDVLAIINKVNSYWQTSNPTTRRAFWDEAAYHTGNMEA